MNHIKERLRVTSIREGRTVKFKILKIAEKLEGNIKLLDIGCDDGKFTLEFAKKIGAKKIYGLEVYDPSIKESRKRGIICKKGNANKKLPFQDNFFHVVLSNQVVEHLINPDKFFEEINRVLKKNGYLYISTPNICSFHGRIFILFGWQPTVIAPSTRFIFGNPLCGELSGFFEHNRHLTCFTPSSFKEMTEFYGFKIIKYTGSVVYPFGKKISSIISTLFPSLSVFQIIKAVKIKNVNIKNIQKKIRKKKLKYKKMI